MACSQFFKGIKITSNLRGLSPGWTDDYKNTVGSKQGQSQHINIAVRIKS